MAFESKYFRLEALADGVYAAISRNEEGGAGGNAGFVDLGGEVLVFDASMLPQAARDLLAAVDALVGKPVRILVNSHYHSDHTYGNGVFPASTLIVAAPATRQVLVEEGAEGIEADKAELPGFLDQLRKDLASAPDDAARQVIASRIILHESLIESIDEVVARPPDVTFEGRMTFHGSARSAQLITYGLGHTEGDVFLYLPDDRIVFTGDLLFAKSHPYLLDSAPEAWRGALNKMLTFDFETVVPGHGEVTGADDIRAQRDYLDAIEALVQKVIAGGGTADDAAGLAVPPEYAAWDGLRRFPDSTRFLFERLSEGA
jgi:cyclase